jgi:uncharacterized protein (TIGR03437 family)
VILMIQKIIPGKPLLKLGVSILALIGLCGSSRVACAQARVYVSNNGDDTVSEIDTSTNAVVATIHVGTGPEGIAISPDGTRAYVANDGGAVWVLDTSNNSVVTKVNVGGDPYAVAITPDGTRVYVTEDNGASVSVIATSTNTVMARIGVTATPAGVAITPDGRHAYVASTGTGIGPSGSTATVQVIDTSSNIVVAKVGLAGLPWGIAVTPDGTRVYVANSVPNISGGSATVSVIDTSTNTVVANVAAGAGISWGVAITPDGTRAYVATGVLIGSGANNGVVSVIDTSSNTVIAKVSVNDPIGLAITPDGTRVYVANDSNFSSASFVSVIDTSSNTVVATVNAGYIPIWVAIKNGSSGPPSLPAITSGGVVPVNGLAGTIQAGEWASIYGTNLAAATVTWAGNFPTSLGGTSVTIDSKAAYLSLVSPGQINLQVPNDVATGPVPVIVTTAGGKAMSTVALAHFGPSFFLLDTKEHVAGIIPRSDGSGAYGGGSFDYLGPTGTSLGYRTVAAKAGDIVELFGTGFGPTNPAAPAGQAFSGAAPTTNPVTLRINNVSVTPTFTGLSGPGLYQINLTVPAGLGTGDVSLQASVGGVQTPSGVVMSLQ